MEGNSGSIPISTQFGSPHFVVIKDIIDLCSIAVGWEGVLVTAGYMARPRMGFWSIYAVAGRTLFIYAQ